MLSRSRSASASASTTSPGGCSSRQNMRDSTKPSSSSWRSLRTRDRRYPPDVRVHVGRAGSFDEGGLAAGRGRRLFGSTGAGLLQQSVLCLLAHRGLVGVGRTGPGRAQRQVRRQRERRATHDRELVRRILAEAECARRCCRRRRATQPAPERTEARRNAAANAPMPDRSDVLLASWLTSRLFARLHQEAVHDQHHDAHADRRIGKVEGRPMIAAAVESRGSR